MNETLIIILVVAGVVVLAALGWWLWRREKSKQLREHFGPEYDRLVEKKGDKRLAEAELQARRERFAKLEIRPLSAEMRPRFARRWQEVQARFVDSPGQAIGEADKLVEEVMRARGYPIEEIQQRQADISVETPGVVGDYRRAWRIAQRNMRREADTEDLRQAMVHYRALFQALLEGGEEEKREKAAEPREENRMEVTR